MTKPPHSGVPECGGLELCDIATPYWGAGEMIFPGGILKENDSNAVSG